MNARITCLALVVIVLAASCSDSSGGGGAATAPTGDAPTTASTDTTAGAIAVPAGVNWAPSALAPPADTSTVVPTFEQVTATAGIPAAPPGFPFHQSDFVR